MLLWKPCLFQSSVVKSGRGSACFKPSRPRIPIRLNRFSSILLLWIICSSRVPTSNSNFPSSFFSYKRVESRKGSWPYQRSRWKETCNAIFSIKKKCSSSVFEKNCQKISNRSGFFHITCSASATDKFHMNRRTPFLGTGVHLLLGKSKVLEVSSFVFICVALIVPFSCSVKEQSCP